MDRRILQVPVVGTPQVSREELFCYIRLKLLLRSGEFMTLPVFRGENDGMFVPAFHISQEAMT
jgi:hypothetical protein